MTKYLETKTNSIEEAIKSVVLEKKLDPVNKVAVKKKFDDRKDKDIDNDGDVDSTDKYLHKRRKAISKAISKEEVEIDEEMRVFFVSDKNSEGNVHAKNEKDAIAQAKKKGLKGKISIRDKGPVSMATRGRREDVELGEGYEANVMKILKRKGLEGAAYFKNNNLMVSKRDFDAVKKALRFDKIPMTPPKIVVEELDEDEKMKRLTKRQRQALARVQAKPKSQVSLPKMPDFMKLKKEENEMDIVDTVRSIVEKKLDPVNKDAVKKKFDDRKDKDIDNDGDVDSTDKYLHKRRKAISKAIKNERVTDVAVDQAKRDLKHAKLKKATDDVKNEVYDIGNDYAKHTLRVTPGQGEKDVDEMLGIAQKKNVGMREALAKVWGLGEGKNPFEKNEKNPLTKEEKHGKTMTGQKPTKVEVEPKMEKK